MDNISEKISKYLDEAHVYAGKAGSNGVVEDTKKAINYFRQTFLDRWDKDLEAVLMNIKTDKSMKDYVKNMGTVLNKKNFPKETIEAIMDHIIEARGIIDDMYKALKEIEKK